ncbi:hypothetical protein [Agrobacterium tumefaciens]|uniref:Uncharacterized protein n=1 Tax=Agrobacterium tumefaciens TaxID=358 RepID=A0A2L2LC27_AGRTU|nr:hypothetical protein [Agrobacterium tumefaciens]AVH41806.1 hypothetical protein At1D1609_17520 [Agrobacterium tumefaciens]NSY95726.1 hypothetical protein [Agrobacterium tumefaciens]
MIFYSLELHGATSYGQGYVLPDGAIEMTEQEYIQALDHAKNAPAQPPSIPILYRVDLWSRLTEDEAEQVELAMASQSARVRNIFNSAASYRSDHELWSLLEETAVDLFGQDRAAEILAPSNV